MTLITSQESLLGPTAGSLVSPKNQHQHRRKSPTIKDHFSSESNDNHTNDRPSSPRVSDRKTWWYARLNALKKRKDELTREIENKRQELESLSGQARSSCALETLEEELRIAIKNKATSKQEYEKAIVNTKKYELESEQILRDEQNLLRSLKKWSDTQDASETNTQDLMQKKRKLEMKQSVDAQRKLALQTGLSSGVVVRERLKEQVRLEREKLKQLQDAWEEKQTRMKSHEIAMENMVSGVAVEEDQLKMQVRSVKDQIEYLLGSSYEEGKRKLKEAEEQAAMRLGEKNRMFEELRSLQVLHQKKLEECMSYDNRVNELNMQLQERESKWRLNHVKSLDEKLEMRKKKNLMNSFQNQDSSSDVDMNLGNGNQ